MACVCEIESEKKETGMRHFMKTLTTPVGKLALVTSEDSVLALVWDREGLENRIGIPEWREGPACALLKSAEKQLGEYFRGQRDRFDLPLKLQGTDFQKRVWAELRKIPFGRTWSYQELARHVGSPAAVRAVGTANGRNPLCIFIPCHRVVRLSGELGGYAGGLENKARLLELERV
jgi:methylated-DNA-[protein]-cysteine S-methyltransferase